VAARITVLMRANTGNG